MNVAYKLALFTMACALAGCATPPTAPITIDLVALNDFHGNLEPSKFTFRDAAGQAHEQQAGGLDAVAAAVQAWRAQDPQLLVVAAGDLVGASPAMSSMWADEPTIAGFNLLGLNASSLGNHEFDSGRVELLRQQRGGCASPRPAKACRFAPDFSGAKFQYLAANVVDARTGAPLLPAWRIEEVKGVKIGFIGAVLKEAAEVVLPSGIEGLAFEDEATAINRAMGPLRAAGATVFVVLIHQGGVTPEPFDQPGCGQLNGAIVPLVRRLDPAIRLVVSGHTHKGYLCDVDGRTVTQAETAGHVLSRIALTVDPATHALRSVDARNVIVTPGEYPVVPAVHAYLATVRARSEAALAQPVARVAVPSVTRAMTPAGESALGDLVADAVLDASAPYGAQIAFMNSGGLRRDLDLAHVPTATYGEVQAVLPFGNTIVLMDLTGQQIVDLLNLQWQRPGVDAGHAMLQVSHSLSYRWDPHAPPGQRVVPGSVKLAGAPLRLDHVYHVAANNFLAEGGDGFPLFAQAAHHVDTGLRDIDALTEYLQKRDHAGTPAGSALSAGRFEMLP